MDFRQATPPTAYESIDLLGSASTASCFNDDFWSPASALTSATTPSPKLREYGPSLLPKVRAQDQMLDVPMQHGHSRTISLPANPCPTQFGSYLPARPSTERRSTSPPVSHVQQTQAPAPSAFDHMIMDPASRRPSLGNMRSVSTSNVRTHSRSRNSSSTSIDASVLGRYGFPTYRQSPGPQPIPVGGAAMSRNSSAMSHLAPIALPNGSMQSYPVRRRTASPPANPSRLSVEVEAEPQYYQDETTTTILDYLTSANPQPSEVSRPAAEPSGPQKKHWWYDVRTVRPWTDFNVDTMAAIPGLLSILQIDVGSSRLPTPAPVDTHPETSAHLVNLCANHHAAKVNAALKVAQGERHMHMSVAAHDPRLPHFRANYQSDREQTIFGDGRGRVVGLVKSWTQWNSGQRSGTPAQQVRYLDALAALHASMREHGCRYAFLITEIELVCVRAGGPPAPHTAHPLFGYLEVSPPIRTATSGRAADGAIQMTAGLALWFLHMLAKEQPLPGQAHWRMDVGAPAELSRQRHEKARDAWMPKIHTREEREAKQVRGWTFPHEPLHKKETGRGRRRKVGGVEGRL